MVGLFVGFVLFLALICLAVPIVYTFSRLMDKIGSERPNEAFLLGLFLWLLGMVGPLGLLEYAAKFLKLPAL